MVLVVFTFLPMTVPMARMTGTLIRHCLVSLSVVGRVPTFLIITLILPMVRLGALFPLTRTLVWPPWSRTSAVAMTRLLTFVRFVNARMP